MVLKKFCRIKTLILYIILESFTCDFFKNNSLIIKWQIDFWLSRCIWPCANLGQSIAQSSAKKILHEFTWRLYMTSITTVSWIFLVIIIILLLLKLGKWGIQPSLMLWLFALFFQANIGLSLRIKTVFLDFYLFWIFFSEKYKFN